MFGEYIFQQLLTTSIIRKTFDYILISIFSNIIQIHLVSIFSVLFTIHPIIDFTIQIVINVFANLNIKYTYSFVEKYRQEIHIITKYIFENYTLDNYRYWKKIIVFTVCLYLIILLSFIQITNRLVYTYIFQYLICFIIIEQFEKKNIHKLYHYFLQKSDIPSLKVHAQERKIIHNYTPQIHTQKSRSKEYNILSERVCRKKESLVNNRYSGTIITRNRRHSQIVQ